ncbi:MAG: hypothetical protein A2663_02415 [Candidatus Buchananbacteria bacterium RIFCSPHIGHO2_01_FULL_46_12]|uniref:Uncharacterized protein n=2 Tax=Candidatus Buchananiibacteriota TaxID=1817903 RepID=A0A1G1Y235_9BACT|nr:MAG: hypothetical protein A2663_02415 [Candidatus Buchananbacteria bacterium RIFCSPHIGHO2_01_FULL_46_12]OGY55816.1 MAG: hypothetical protein A3H67_01380 [Candidatus Buchananbacteria bacterium RIFCSPLOWO2_02_FULL_46_11b]
MPKEQSPESRPREERQEELVERASDILAQAQTEAKMRPTTDSEGKKSIPTSLEIGKQMDQELNRLRAELFPEIEGTDWQKLKDEIGEKLLAKTAEKIDA